MKSEDTKQIGEEIKEESKFDPTTKEVVRVICHSLAAILAQKEEYDAHFLTRVGDAALVVIFTHNAYKEG